MTTTKEKKIIEDAIILLGYLKEELEDLCDDCVLDVQDDIASIERMIEASREVLKPIRIVTV